MGIFEDEIMIKEIVSLVGISAFILLMVSPFYNFPLNDDWVYAMDVNNFLNTGNITLFKYTSANYVFQLLSAALFTTIFGFSYANLRIFTMIFSIIGIVGMYLLLKQLKFNSILSFFGALFLLLNPIYYNLSHTFMTDVPFLVLIIYSILFYLKGIDNNNDKFLLLGSIFSVMSFLVRQYGILIVLAVILYFKIYRKSEFFTKRKLFILVVFPFISFILSIYWFWAFQNVNLQSGHLLLNVKSDAFWSIMNMGMFLFPFAILYLLNWDKIIKTKKQLYLLVAILMGMGLFYGYNILTEVPKPTANSFSTGPWWALPQRGNIINPISLGPLLMEGGRAKIFPDFVWVLITISAGIVIFFIGSFILMKYQVIKEIILLKCKSEQEIPFIYLIGIVYILILFRSGTLDRYLLIFIPVLIPIFLESINKFRYIGIFLVTSLLIFGFWSVVYTDDYMKTNNAKWDAINYLLDKGVPPKEINGGIEFGGTYLFEHVIERLGDTSRKSDEEAFYYENATYVISLSELEGYGIEKEFSYNNFFGRESIYVLKRQNLPN